MTTEQFDREKNYLAAVAVARAMLKQRIIDDDDFDKMEVVFRMKFSPPIGVFRG